MAKLTCLLVLAFAACIVAGLPQDDVSTPQYRVARSADPQPQYGFGGYGHGHGHGGYGHGGYGHGGYGHGHVPHDHLVPHCDGFSCHVDVIHHH